MMQAQLPQRSLPARAFLHQKNLILLGGAGLFSAALASPWPAVAGVLGEIIWLAAASSSTRVRQLAFRHEAEAARGPSTGLRAAALASLDPPQVARVQALQALADDIRRLGRERGIDPSPLDRPQGGLDALLLGFIRMSALSQQLGRSLAGGSQLDIRRRALGSKMANLEKAFDQLRAQLLGGTTAAGLEQDLDQLHAGLHFLPAAEAEAQAALVRRSGSPTTRITSLDLPVQDPSSGNSPRGV